MKHWSKTKIDHGHSPEGLLLKGDKGRILFVAKSESGITFTECCDEYFQQTYDKEEALELIEELRQYILSDT